MNASSMIRGLLTMVVVGVMTPAALLDCGGAVAGDGGSGGAGGSGNPDGGACPVSAPTEGSACAIEGTMCSGYATSEPISNCACCGGGGSSWVCEVGGKWTELESANAGGPSIAPACPASIPTAGAACTPIYSSCGPARLECNYDCATGGGTAGIASCSNGTWSVTASNETCVVDSGIDAWTTLDAGAEQ